MAWTRADLAPGQAGVLAGWLHHAGDDVSAQRVLWGERVYVDPLELPHQWGFMLEELPQAQQETLW